MPRSFRWWSPGRSGDHIAATADRITWYDILGISPGASSVTVRRVYLDKASRLGQAQLAGAPARVMDAVARGRMVLDAAWLALGNPAGRERYDGLIGASHVGAGLIRDEPVPSRPGLDPADAITAAGALGSGELLEGLGALADWLAPIPCKPRSQARTVIVPDLRGLFSGPCQDILIRLRFRISTVQLTDQPMPVEGLVVDQSPAPGEAAYRSSTLTVHVWHPPRPHLREP